MEGRTLEIFRTGCDPKNYKILKSIVNEIKDINELKEIIGLSQVRTYARISDLKKVGLVNLKKGSGLIEPTEITQIFLNLLKQINREILKNINKYLQV